MGLVDLSLKRRVTISMVAVAVVLFGLVAFSRLPVSLLPDLSYPSLTVETRYPGAAPAEVEALVSRPIEEVVGVVSGVERLTSTSRPGLSQVVLEFGWGRDMDFAALDVRQKLDLLSLPRDAERPVLLRFDTADEPVLRLYLTATDGLPLTELRYAADEVLKKDLESTAGVAAIKVNGGVEEEIEVRVDEGRLALLGLSIQEVGRRLLRENVNQAGGSLYESEARYLVRAINELEGEGDVMDTVIASREGRNVTLGDVATVVRGSKRRDVITRYGDGSANREAVELALYKEGDANTVTVAQAVKSRLEAIGDELPEGVAVSFGADQSRFIEASIRQVLGNALLGGLIAMLVLLLFLKNLRSTLIIGISIPVSVIATFFLMYRTGTSLNVMSLGGLALGVGMLVDNAIVVLEAISKHREGGAGWFEASRRGAGEVGRAVAASTLTTVAVFLPVVFLEGVAAQLFRDMALTVSFSLLASLAVALTLIPMLTAAVGGGAGDGAGEGARERGGTFPETPRRGPVRRAAAWLFVTLPGKVLWLVRRAVALVLRLLALLARPVTAVFDAALGALSSAYPRALRWSLRNRAVVLAVALFAFAGALALVPGLGFDLIPDFAQGEFGFRVELPEGTPLEVTDRYVAGVARVLEDDPRVASHATLVGGKGFSLTSTGTEGENVARLQVRLAPGSDAATETAVTADLRHAFESAGGARFELERPTVFTLRTPIEVELYGDDLSDLHAAGAAVQRRLAKVPGLVDVRSSAEIGNPELQIHFQREPLARLGLDLAQVAEVVRNKVQGDVATRLTEGDREIDVVVRTLPSGEASVADVAELIVGERDGRPIYLSSVARVELTEGPTEVRRIGQNRAAVVSASLAGRDMGGAAEDVAAALAELEGAGALPATVTAQLSGQEEERQRSLASLTFAMALAVFLVYLVMASQFESFLHPFVVIFSLPLGAIGVVAALALTGRSIDVVAMIGAVMLAGIVVNNAIVLIDAVNQRRRAGTGRTAALVAAGSDRLRPILMTSATTILGLAPMALGLGEGAELRAPLAITVIGGLACATPLTLLVIPVVYSVFDRAPEEATEGAADETATAGAPLPLAPGAEEVGA